MMVEINDAVADEIKQTASENQPSNFIIGLVEKNVDTEVKATTTNVIKIGNFIVPQNATRLLNATTVAAVDTPTVAVVQQNHDAMQVQITHKNKIISFNCTIFCKILPKTKKPRKCVTYRLPLMGKLLQIKVNFTKIIIPYFFRKSMCTLHGAMW